MKLTLGVKSTLFFFFTILILAILSMFETYFVRMPITIERILSIVLLVVPGVIGIIYGLRGMMRKEPKVWIAVLGVLLNGLSVTFHIFLLSFAG